MPWCPACRRQFRGAPDQVGARCPRCREPLYERGDPPRRPGEGVAACATHPDNAAAGTCQRCGNFACTVCRTRWRDRMLCGACLERELESNAAAPDEARMQTLQAVLSLVFAVGGWVLVVLAFVLIVAGMEGGGGPNYLLVGVGGLMIMASPGPAVLAVGQAVAALRARGGHMILATLGLLLGGLHVGAIIGLFTFSLWQNY